MKHCLHYRRETFQAFALLTPASCPDYVANCCTTFGVIALLASHPIRCGTQNEGSRVRKLTFRSTIDGTQFGWLTRRRIDSTLGNNINGKRYSFRVHNIHKVVTVHRNSAIVALAICASGASGVWRHISLSPSGGGMMTVCVSTNECQYVQFIRFVDVCHKTVR